jgi:K+/H+ antiporter YhaU regulatory subunit KhtT
MNDENKIDLSIEMYEDLKETLVKAIKNAKTGKTDGSIHSDNAQTERIERLIEATEHSQRQVAQLLEHVRKQIKLPGVQNGQEPTTEKYNALLAQLAGRLEVIDKENGKTHALIEQVGKAVEAAAKPENLPVQEHRHTYTLDLKSSKTFLTMFVMLGGIFLQSAFIYRISENNRQLAMNDLKYRYVKMRGKIGEKELTKLETVFWDEQYRNLRDTVRNQVERYEEAVRRQAERLEQATVKERKAKKLLDDVKKLREE